MEVYGASSHLAQVHIALQFCERLNPKVTVRAHVGFPATMLCQSSVVRDAWCFTPCAWVWSHYGLIGWLFIYSDAGVNVRSQDWLREVSQSLSLCMIIGASVRQGQLSGCSVIGKSEVLARLVTFSPSFPVSVFLIINLHFTRTSECQREREEDTMWAGRKCAYTVSKVIMKWQLWHVSVLHGGLITGSFYKSQNLSFLCI